LGTAGAIDVGVVGVNVTAFFAAEDVVFGGGVAESALALSLVKSEEADAAECGSDV
jgi:hypothetical protein